MAYTARFLRILSFIFKWECVYDKRGNVIAECDPDDPGGLTKYGIDKRSHPDVDIKNLTKEQATEIYYREYWVKYGCEWLHHPLGEVYFNCCVNCGKARASKILVLIYDSDAYKAAVAFLNEQEAFYRRLVKSKPQLWKFLNGWINRAGALRKFIST